MNLCAQSAIRGNAGWRPAQFWSACCLALVLVTGCGPQFNPGKVGRSRDDWVQFTSKSGKFTARYPSVPVEKRSEDGKGLVFGAEFANGDRFVQVSIDPQADMDVTLAERLDAIRKKLQTARMSVKDIVVDGHAGLDARYDRTREGITYDHRHQLFYVDGALYQVLGVAVKEPQGAADLDRFAESFHFLPEAAAPAKDVD
jgi:hypothetical protein